MYTIVQIIDNIIRYIVYPFFLSLATLIFIYAGILFATSSGDPSKITRAKQAVMIAIIGIFIGVGSAYLLGFIKYIIIGQ